MVLQDTTRLRAFTDLSLQVLLRLDQVLALLNFVLPLRCHLRKFEQLTLNLLLLRLFELLERCRISIRQYADD